MQVQISGKHIDVGDALRSRISDELLSSIGKYFERGGDADVVVGKNGHAFKVDCSVRLASGHRLECSGAGGDAHAAFGAALTKVEARIRRYKRRLKNHHRPLPRAAEAADGAPILADESDEATEAWNEALGRDILAGGEASQDALCGMVIAETQAPKTLTVSMAVREMDLTESRAIMFRNAAHGGLSVVYRRSDGNIGWIDPERMKSPV